MAKSNKAAITRIATTVTARFYPTTGATDGFYLDGRLSGRREHRAADVTLDREERGFFYAVFAHLTGGATDENAVSPVKKPLDKIMTEVKQPGHNIDAEINELAECAVSVVGRIALKNDGMRQPYFAGILVRDSEMAAVTMGNGCAYLYRGDVLYPLTSDDYPLEAIDYAGKPISGIDVYCAGVAGTVRYSNIAQLQMDDCLITCNREVMEALGQREILRMLYEAEDQADAAGMIITAAAAKLPGTPMQFMIGFVENITSADRTARLGMTRSHADTAAVASAAVPAAFPSLNRNRPQAAAEPKKPVTDLPHEAEEADLDFIPPKKAERPATATRPQPVPYKQSPSRLPEQREEPFDEEDDSFGDEIDTYGRGRRIAFYVIIAAICVACLFLIYSMLFKDKDTPGTTTTTTTQASGQTSSGTSGSSQTTTTTATSESTTTTSTATTTTTTTTSAGIMTTHTVVAGDTIWGLAMKYYGVGDFEHMNLIAEANGMKLIQDGDDVKLDRSLRVDEVLKIPNKP